MKIVFKWEQVLGQEVPTEMFLNAMVMTLEDEARQLGVTLTSSPTFCFDYIKGADKLYGTVIVEATDQEETTE